MALKVPSSFVHALPIVWRGEMHWIITEESFDEFCGLSFKIMISFFAAGIG